ncbi:putative pyrophosphatase/phosphodiesterase [Cladophialophora carrionii]|uniref:Putative pyrophosphatase/phosphodiesterase n=1 Tax=Cladophialophora carrionii TaxID=86049 RepID=A0A1C1CI19_9EURO|nr:putative pyrophosphatase/phosphodiesterase [Cladophialophora carrionii]
MARDRDGLFSEKHYDDDAALVPSESESENDNESAEEEDVREGDRDILDEAEEHEKLLHKPSRLERARGAFGLRDGTQEGGSSSKRPTKSTNRRSRKRGMSTPDKMEGGFTDTNSEDSFEIQASKWEIKTSRKSHRGRLALIYLAIVGLFVALLFGAYRASSKKHSLAPTEHRLTRYNNGTHIFRPTTIFISLDGFRADFLNRNITPALSAFITSGVSPKYMLPSFPSVTFPNHFTLVTGLYPESHGVVSNQFWDPEFQEEFWYTNISVSMQPKWWNAEPLWVTAEHQGVRSAIHMWPGSEAHIPDVEPTYMDKYNGTEALPRKVDSILRWLDMPGDDDVDVAGNQDLRPQFIAAYVPNVDADGHLYGPNSTEIRATIADVDSMLTMLVEGLLARNLTEIVNMVIVSDHGMATTSTSRLVQLDDLIDMSLVDHIDGWPLRGLRLKNPDRDVPILYEALSQAAATSGNFDVYTLETMPERYHFTKNDRIAPLWIVPKTGWAVVEKSNFDVAEALATGKEYEPKGLHGYDHEHPLMRAIFVARGPAFPHEPNSQLPIFQNIEVYNIMCDSLGIVPHPNNGTLRLPLKTQGLHSEDDNPGSEIVADPVEDEKHEGENTPSDDDSDTSNPSTNDPLQNGDDSSPDTPLEGGAPSDTAQGDGASADLLPDEDSPPADDGDGEHRTSGSWWSFVHEQLEKAKEWAKEFAESIKGNKEGEGDPPV